MTLRQFLCGLHGHDALLQYEPGRLFLRCTSCGHETPGWRTGKVDDQQRAQLRQMLREPRTCEAGR